MLVCCTVAALAFKGLVPTWVAVIVIGRVVLLVGGVFVYRLQTFKWSWPGMAKFCETTDGALATAGVPYMQPLLISKVNTAMQLLLVSGCLLHAWQGWPSTDLLSSLEYATASTTLASLAAYAHRYHSGKVFDSN